MRPAQTSFPIRSTIELGALPTFISPSLRLPRVSRSLTSLPTNGWD